MVLESIMHCLAWNARVVVSSFQHTHRVTCIQYKEITWINEITQITQIVQILRIKITQIVQILRITYYLDCSDTQNYYYLERSEPTQNYYPEYILEDIESHPGGLLGFQLVIQLLINPREKRIYILSSSINMHRNSCKIIFVASRIK